MKSALEKGWKYLLGGVLALLGFGSCNKEGIIDNGGNMLVMYGQPTAVFKMHGTVKNQSGKPVKGIRVVIEPHNNPWEYDTLYTDASGRFEKDRLKHSWPDELKNVTVRFEDVDGAENGSYRMKELKRSDIQVKQTDKGKGAWFEGSFTVTADAVLEKEDQ